MVMKLISLQKVSQPLKNERFVMSTGMSDNMSRISENLYRLVRESSELLSMLDSVVTDHFMGNVDFFDTNSRPMGPTKFNKIKTFWEDSNVQKNAFYGQALDYFIDGSSFGWHISANSILTAKQKEAIIKIKERNMSLGTDIEEMSNMPRSISYIAASTVDIMYNEFGEQWYKQMAAGKEVRWNNDQVVHIKNMEFNGEIRGMAPLKAITKECVMMYMLKENILAKLENGGSPDYIISMKNANGTSKARFNRLKIALESFSHLKKSHGNMPIDGDVNVLPLGTELKDMEYRELAMFVISEFGLALGLPTSRIPFLMTGSGGSTNKGELSGNSEDSYQTKINSRRTDWENAWNKVFRKAGFTFRFRRTNLQDDVRETQALTQRQAYVSGVQSSLALAKKQLKITSLLAMLSGTQINITEEDIEDKEEEEFEMDDMGNPIAGIGGKMQPGNMNNKSKVSKDKSAAKEKTATNNGVYT